MLRVGLTGGIACGKTLVLRVLAAAGLRTLDLDRVTHELLGPGGAACEAVVAGFGEELRARDGSIDRKRLGALVFAEPSARARLNEIMHPRVRETEARTLRLWEEGGARAAVVDGALLVEVGVHLRFRRLVVVHCPPEIQIERLMARDGIDAAAARVRIAAQMPLADKRAFGHLEVDTSGTRAAAQTRAAGLATELQALAEAPPDRRVASLERRLGGVAHGALHGPGGLSSVALLEEIASVGGLETRRVGRLLTPPVGDPWYAPGRPRPGAGPMAWAPAVTAGCATAAGADSETLAAAMATLGRLVKASPEASAAGVFLARACLDLTYEPTRPIDEESAATQARRWAHHGPPATLRALVARAHVLPADPGEARRAALADGLDPEAAGALAGVRSGALPSDYPRLAEALSTLDAVRARG